MFYDNMYVKALDSVVLDYSAFSEESILKTGPLMWNSELVASLTESNRVDEYMFQSRSLYIRCIAEIPRLMFCVLTRGWVV